MYSYQVAELDSPKVPPFLMDNRLTMPSINGPATSVPSIDATNDERFVRPTDDTEKLYGGAEKICERVTEMPTSHEIQVVKSRVAHSTAGDPSILNGRRRVLKKET